MIHTNWDDHVHFYTAKVLTKSDGNIRVKNGKIELETSTRLANCCVKWVACWIVNFVK